MIRILQIVPSLNCCGGVENYIMNYYRNITDSEIKFDFVYHINSEPNFEEEIRNLGGNCMKMPVFSVKNYKKIKKEIINLFKNNKYDIVHCHMANAAFLYFKIAKKYGVKVRILHSHQASAADKFLHKIRNYPLLVIGKKRATNFVACSNLAGEFLFKNKTYKVINNAINTSKFSYSDDYRSEIRDRYNIDNDTIVFGHIGRFCNQKNQLFLLRIFSEFIKNKDNKKYKLMLVGDGELRVEIEKSISKYNINDYVILTGAINDTSKIYSALDLFILPSLYEGLPVVGVEAQYNGLKVLTSSNVTKELNFSGNVEYYELSDEIWVNTLNKAKIERFNVDNPDYNIDLQVKLLVEYYKSLV